MLAVDIGNTFTRIVAFAGETIRTRKSLPTRELELGALQNAFAECAAEAEALSVWIASVNPGVNALVDSAAGRVGLERHFIKPGSDHIIAHALKTPATTGVDRLLSAMAAGVLHFPGAAASGGYVVIQCGSAATVDLVDGAGVFRGGYILPGPTMWLSGLSGGAQLPNLSNELPDWNEVFVGDNTHDALVNGMHLALPVAVASAALLINTPDGLPVGKEPLPAVVTGGWGAAALPYMRPRTVYEKDLLLHGIRLFAERNT